MVRKLMLAAAFLLCPLAAANAEHVTVVVTPSYHEPLHYVAPVVVETHRVYVAPAPVVVVHPVPVVRTVTTTTVTTQSVHYVR